MEYEKYKILHYYSCTMQGKEIQFVFCFFF